MQEIKTFEDAAESIINRSRMHGHKIRSIIKEMVRTHADPGKDYFPVVNKSIDELEVVVRGELGDKSARRLIIALKNMAILITVSTPVELVEIRLTVTKWSC